jgi:quinol-cytochrome oxidoreductase complex cytochrome b subunit
MIAALAKFAAHNRVAPAIIFFNILLLPLFMTGLIVLLLVLLHVQKPDNFYYSTNDKALTMPVLKLLIKQAYIAAEYQ